ncbi:heavy metal translocating P-type ATPase [uncultured Robinsoniella sp.]|uniref:heavy metal translocating P-type ATPase n=1 Tax=uncultured Robinsoniella sp. TaxID=904190 RepID=UPI00374F3235
MNFVIKHEITGRMRIHIKQNIMTLREADLLLYYLSSLPQVKEAKVYNRTADAVICYEGKRGDLIKAVGVFRYDREEVQALVPEHTGRALNQKYQEKLINKVAIRAVTQIFLPAPLKVIYTAVMSVKYIIKGVKCLWRRKLKVEVLDAAAIAVSVLRRDFGTAGSVMFLLGIGEILEEWTRKKSLDDLARSMSLNIEKVWLKQGETEVLVPISQIREGDLVTVHMGNLIPLDGTVASGESMVNQASLTGESMPVKKESGSTVYAGTVVEEGEITIQVRQAAGATRYEKIVTMIEESEKLKSSVEGKASNLANVLVPYSLGGTLLTYLLTRNVQKALSILMVDFSCALKLAMPVSVLSAMREAGNHHITVKGGKYLEAAAEADTIVFDKTGTLTKAKPVVADIITFSGRDQNEMLRIAACLEEHFPHSMANAVIQEARKRNLTHEEMHTKVEYIVAHGIASYINGEKVLIGSSHFVFEDEKSLIPPEEMDKFEGRPDQYSHLYLAIAGQLAAIICIADPLREEAKEVVSALRNCGFKRIVMMTGDSDWTANAIARSVGIEEYYSEVLPEDKADFIQKVKANGHKVVMIGDGINDSPALSAADVGIAVSEGAALAREIADITISADDLTELVTLKRISMGLMKRINWNYRSVIGFNLGLIVLGVTGVLAPATSALLHNTSTLVISLKSMTNVL